MSEYSRRQAYSVVDWVSTINDGRQHTPLASYVSILQNTPTFNPVPRNADCVCRFGLRWQSESIFHKLPMYQYQRMSSPTTVRILALQPGQPWEHLQGTMIETDLSQAHAWYIAISYNRGSESLPTVYLPMRRCRV